jgi:hypothetical protein
MPLLKSKSTSSSTIDTPTSSPTHKWSIFSSHATTSDSSTPNSGLPSRRRSNSSNSDRSEVKSNRFFGLGRNNKIEDDPSIRRARQKVADAEKAEKEADIALNVARDRVREALKHVKSLEEEALEE